LKLQLKNHSDGLAEGDDSVKNDQYFDCKEPTGDDGHYADGDSHHCTGYDAAKKANCDDDRCYPNVVFVLKMSRMLIERLPGLS
jgi:hypothetical protein